MSEPIYKLLSVTGGDAGQFLQGQLTQDIALVDRTGCLPAAWCNPRGRVIAVMRVVVIDGGYGLVLPASLADRVRDRLAIYRLRADVGLDIANPDWIHLVFHTGEDTAELESHRLRPERKLNACQRRDGLTAVNIGIGEPCVEVFGFEADFRKVGIQTDEHSDLNFLAAARIRAGIPEILEVNSEKYTPHMLNLDLIGAVSFDKGCYTGQEVIARTENLGSSRRRLMRYRTSSNLRPGDKLFDNEKSLGDVVNVCGNELLAVTPVDMHMRSFFADDAEVIPAPMPYTTTN